MVIFKDLLNETNIWKIALYLTATMFISALVFLVASLKKNPLFFSHRK